jgi:hypothetical protein
MSSVSEALCIYYNPNFMILHFTTGYVDAGENFNSLLKQACIF